MLESVLSLPSPPLPVYTQAFIDAICKPAKIYHTHKWCKVKQAHTLGFSIGASVVVQTVKSACPVISTAPAKSNV